MLIHVVKSGESLWQIAAKYRVSMARIISVNRLQNPSQLAVGQALVVPTVDISHTVKPGETLYQVARRYGISLKTLIDINNIKNPELIYPGTVLTITGKSRPVIEVNAYIYQYGESAVPTIREVGEHLTYLSPFAYMIREDGNLDPILDNPAIRAAYAERVVPMLSVTNFTSTQAGSNLAHIVLSTPQIRDRTITNIIGVIKEKGYRGVNIDFENVLPADRELYNQFLQLTVDRLHPEGFFVSTALAPKTSVTQTGTLYEAHDYEAHGRIADFVVLMTYEWGYRKGPPQSISPINQIKRVLDYAVSVIPRDKIFFGFQIYARDWVIPHLKGMEAETFDNQEAEQRAVRYSAAIRYDTATQTPYYQYKDEKGIMHEVWFEDARSAQAKFDMVKSYGIRGISYWVIGYPFPQNWALLQDNFTIKKLI